MAGDDDEDDNDVLDFLEGGWDAEEDEEEEDDDDDNFEARSAILEDDEGEGEEDGDGDGATSYFGASNPSSTGPSLARMKGTRMNHLGGEVVQDKSWISAVANGILGSARGEGKRSRQVKSSKAATAGSKKKTAKNKKKKKKKEAQMYVYLLVRSKSCRSKLHRSNL